MKKAIMIISFLMICSVVYAQTISRQNIKPKADYKANGEHFYMVNLVCDEINTSLPSVRNSTFERCNIWNCMLDESNIFIQSVYEPEYYKPIPRPKTDEELKARVLQLEKFIEDNSLPVPTEVSQ